eukprot:gene6093-12300_t
MNGRGRGRPDPNDWADKRKAAMEKAKQIKESRMSDGDDRRSSSVAPKPVDILDELTGLECRIIGGGQKMEDFDYLNPAKNKKRIPPPDSLEKEVKAKNLAAAQPVKGKQKDVPPVTNSRSKAEIEAQESFEKHLRGNGSERSLNGSSWNDDIQSSGIPPIESTKRYRPRRGTVQPNPEDGTTTPPVRTSSRISMQLDPTNNDTTANIPPSVPRARLALLKAKLRTNSAPHVEEGSITDDASAPRSAPVTDSRASRRSKEDLLYEKASSSSKSSSASASAIPLHPPRSQSGYSNKPDPSEENNASSDRHGTSSRVSGASGYSEDAFESEDAFGPSDESGLLECPDCGRKFNETAYPKHVKICKKVFINKRKPLDMVSRRLEANPEIIQLQKKSKKTGKKTENGNTTSTPFPGNGNGGGGGGDAKSKWKAQSDALRNAMKAARQVKDAIASGKPLPPPVASAPDPSLIPCPHCGRRFNEQASDRHMTFCAQKSQSKPGPSRAPLKGKR